MSNLASLRDHTGSVRLLAALREPRPLGYWKYPTPPRGVAATRPRRCIVGGIHAVDDQGSIGSCVLNALTMLLEILCRRDGLNVELSRLQTYYDGRAVRGWQNQDSGVIPEDAIRQMSTIGAGPEELWVYDTSKVFVKPSPGVYAAAYNFRIKEWYRYEAIDALLTTISMGATQEGLNPLGIPVAHSFSVPANYQSAWRNGLWLPDATVVDDVGGHEELWIGYDLDVVHPQYGEPGVLYQLNSWGEDGGITLPEYPQFRGGFMQVPIQEVKVMLDRWWDNHVCTKYEVVE